jgi:hypothetical protein
VFRLFAHLVNNHKARVVFDPTYPVIDEDTFVKANWKAMYGDVKEVLPPDAPLPLGKEVDLCLYVDSEHTRDKFTRRSRTGFVIYLKMAPVVWLSKQQGMSLLP